MPREQATRIADDLLAGKRSVLLAGTAGEGKSCIVAQVVERLGESLTPHIVLSMDELTDVISAAELGERLGLPASPAIVLGQMSAGRRAVLCIDQLDALSSVSGRNVHQRQLLEELIQQAERYPELRLFLACRSFDLEHDDALLGLVNGEPADGASSRCGTPKHRRRARRPRYRGSRRDCALGLADRAVADTITPLSLSRLR